jgi:hypothetical protein
LPDVLDAPPLPEPEPLPVVVSEPEPDPDEELPLPESDGRCAKCGLPSSDPTSFTNCGRVFDVLSFETFAARGFWYDPVAIHEPETLAAAFTSNSPFESPASKSSYCVPDSTAIGMGCAMYRPPG